MRFISIDIEANQPTNKIIQIGAAAFDTDSKMPTKPVAEFNQYLDPEEDINWDQDLRGGLTLGELLGPDFKSNWTKDKRISTEVFQDLWDWTKAVNCGKKFIQWGRGDMLAIIQHCAKLGVRYPTRIQSLDLKLLYRYFYQPGLRLNKSPGGLTKACEALNIEFTGRAHDALVDAVNTGKVAVKMYQVIRGYSDIVSISKKE